MDGTDRSLDKSSESAQRGRQPGILGKAFLALLSAGLIALAVIVPFGKDRSGEKKALTIRQLPASIERKLSRGVKSPFNQPSEAMEFYLQQRTGGAPLDYGRIEQAKAQILRMPQADFGGGGIGRRDSGDITGWRELGPGNIGGRTRAVLIHPTDANEMYIGGIAGGVWKTVDGGATWAPLDDLMANLAITTLAFEPMGSGSVSTSSIYAGTGEGFFNGDAVRGAGIFKSTDSGATWSQLADTDNPDFRYVSRIVGSPNRAMTLYAATQTGVWKTADGGSSWTSVLANSGAGGPSATQEETVTGLTDIEIRHDLAIDTLIASSGSFVTDGIYRSLDAGANWSRVFIAANMGRTDLAIAPSNGNTMYALSSDNANGHRLLNVYRSTDGGANWSPRVMGASNPRQANWLLLTNPIIANLEPCFGGFDSFISQGWYDNVIAVAPHNENVVFAGGIDMFRSDDGGGNWGPISYWWLTQDLSEYSHADQHAIVFDPGWNGASNQTMIVGNDGGIFKSANAMARVSTGTVNGAEDGLCFNMPAVPTAVVWTNLNNGYGVTQFYHGRPYPGSATTYFGGTQDNGTLRGSDATGIDGWIEINGGDGGYVSYDPFNLNILFAETTRLSIERSTNAGFTFDFITPNGILEDPSFFLFINPFRHDPNDANRLWTGGFFAWRSNRASSASNEDSVTWSQASDLLPGLGSVSAWAIDPSNSSHVVVGMSDGAVARTTTALSDGGGSNWPEITPPWGGRAFTSWIEFDSSDGNGQTYYATNSRFGVSLAKVMKTTTDGAFWSDITSNLPDIPVHCIVVQNHLPANLFIGTDLGVFASTDMGATWASMNSSPDFANVVVESLEFQNDTTLYAFTHGRGVWRATIEFSSPTATPTSTPPPTPTATLSPTVTSTSTPNSTPTSTPTPTPLPEVGFCETASSLNETSGDGSICVELNAAANQTIEVDYRVTGGTATRDDDYALADGRLSFAPGELSKTIEFAIVDDIEIEVDETVTLELLIPMGATIDTARREYILTIEDNDPEPAGLRIDNWKVKPNRNAPVKGKIEFKGEFNDADAQVDLELGGGITFEYDGGTIVDVLAQGGFARGRGAKFKYLDPTRKGTFLHRIGGSSRSRFSFRSIGNVHAFATISPMTVSMASDGFSDEVKFVPVVTTKGSRFTIAKNDYDDAELFIDSFLVKRFPSRSDKDSIRLTLRFPGGAGFQPESDTLILSMGVLEITVSPNEWTRNRAGTKFVHTSFGAVSKVTLKVDRARRTLSLTGKKLSLPGPEAAAAEASIGLGFEDFAKVNALTLQVKTTKSGAAIFRY